MINISLQKWQLRHLLNISWRQALKKSVRIVCAPRVARHLQFKREAHCLKTTPSDFADNRAWTNPENKSQLGCIGKDYVKDSNLLVFRYFWNDTHQVLAGTVEFTSATEGPPGSYVCHMDNLSFCLDLCCSLTSAPSSLCVTVTARLRARSEHRDRF